VDFRERQREILVRLLERLRVIRRVEVDCLVMDMWEVGRLRLGGGEEGGEGRRREEGGEEDEEDIGPYY
jgi:hypothetical protein